METENKDKQLEGKISEQPKNQRTTPKPVTRIRLDGKTARSSAGRKPDKDKPPKDGIDTSPPPEPAMRPTRTKKPVSKIRDPYKAAEFADKALKEAAERREELFDRIEKEHPNSKIRAIFGEKKRKPAEKPLIDPDLLSDPIRTTYKACAYRCEYDYIPEDSSFETVARSCAEVTRHLNIEEYPLTAALAVALTNIGLLFGPMAIYAIRGGKKREKRDVQETD